MGLDMYLTRHTYVKNWDHMKPEERHTITINGPMANKIDTKKISHIVEDIGYWRNANAIHNWFVKNVQEGNDDYREYGVDESQLQELLDLVRRVLVASKLVNGKAATGYTIKDGVETPILEDGLIVKDITVAQELLPTEEGFFFGSTNYDQYYIQDLKDTEKILEDALQMGGEFYYQSSW
jgi:hypothetical protein